MSDTTTKKPQRKLTSLELSAPARGALRRIKSRHGVNHTHAIVAGIFLYEEQLQKAGRGL